MIDKLVQYFCQKGFLRMAIRESQVGVVFRITKDGLYFVCLIDDTEGWLQPGQADRMMVFLRKFFAEKYPQYTAKVDGLMIPFTKDPQQTKSKLEGSFSYWLAFTPARKLMIYEDQPDPFYDTKEILEGFWNQSPLVAVLSQLKVLGSPVNLTLIGLNILVFIIVSIVGSSNDVDFMHTVGAMAPWDVLENGQVWRLGTAMFLHFGVMHLVYNMVSLLYLGRALEEAMKPVPYLAVYLLSGVMAGVTSIGWHMLMDEPYVVCAGASGAICGVAGALAYIMLRNRKQNKSFSMVRWAIFVAVLMGQGLGETGVDNAAHIGGVVFGFILGAIFYEVAQRKNKTEKTTGGLGDE